MEKFNLIAGIDVSKATLDVSYSLGEAKSEHIQFANSAKGLSELVKLLLSKDVDREAILVCCEHTGSYMDKLSLVLESERIKLWAVNPYLIKTFSMDLNRMKTDRADSGKILEYALTHQKRAKQYKRPEEGVQNLRDLFLVRKQLVKVRAQVYNFISSSSDKALPPMLSNMILEQLKAFLSQLIGEVTNEINNLMKKEVKIKAQAKILCSLPGIGEVISKHMIIASEAFEKFPSYREFACFIGTAPFARSSGSSLNQKPRTSKKAYQPLKADLHQGVIAVIKKGQLFHDYYHAMKAKGKHHLWIINSIMNILLKLAFLLIKQQKQFDKNLFLQNKKSWKNLAMS